MAAGALLIARRAAGHAGELGGHARAVLRSPGCWNNAWSTSPIAGPRTREQIQEYLDALGPPFDAEDEAFVSALVPPGHASTPGYTDAAVPGGRAGGGAPSDTD